MGKKIGNLRGMMDYRVEAIADQASGLFYVEVFYPSNATTPVAKTKAVYASLEEARRRGEEAITATFPEHATTVPATSPVSDVLLIDNA